MSGSLSAATIADIDQLHQQKLGHPHLPIRWRRVGSGLALFVVYGVEVDAVDLQVQLQVAVDEPPEAGFWVGELEYQVDRIAVSVLGQKIVQVESGVVLAEVSLDLGSAFAEDQREAVDSPREPVCFSISSPTDFITSMMSSRVASSS